MIYKGICNICETKDVNVLQIEIDGEIEVEFEAEIF